MDELQEMELWAAMFGADNLDLLPAHVERALLSGKVAHDEQLWQAIEDYRRDLAEAHEKLLRVYRSAGKRWLRFLNRPGGRP